MDVPKNRHVVFVMLLLTFIHHILHSFFLLDSKIKEAH